jgi:hypothetical protein
MKGRLLPLMQRIYKLRVELMPGEELTVDREWTFIPSPAWTPVQGNEYIQYFENRKTGARFAASAGTFDGVAYIHSSVSRAKEMPSYADLCELKEAIFGPHRYAAMVMPPKTFHVNIHPNCLHLWGPLDPRQWPMPEFGLGGTI